MHCLVSHKSVKLWEPLVTQVTDVAFLTGIIAHVMLKKVLIAGLRFGLGAEGATKLFS
jgi:hypothetical protein